MARSRRPLTITDLVALLVIGLIILVCGGVLLLPGHRRVGPEAYKATCRANLYVLGEAVASYRQVYDSYFPFSWGPATEAPRKKDAITSLALLYPEFVNSPSLFGCPSAPSKPVLLSERTSQAPTLVDSAYGYDCRVAPGIAGGHAIAGDGDRAYHSRGRNVLYVDGHASWWERDLCSNDFVDNAFREDPWHADTDSFISDNTSPFDPSNRATDRYNDLKRSYDSYETLHPPKE